MSWFPSYQYTENKVVSILERPSWPQTFIIAAQHMLAMFGGTVLVPFLCGFDTNTALFFSGIGTILFYFTTGGRVPSYLGSSFAFLGVILTATKYTPGTGINPNISVALGGILANGIVYAVIALIVMAFGYKWIEYLLPPVVTGSIVMAIGLHLAKVAVDDSTLTPDSVWQSSVTAIIVALISVFAPGIVGRLPILIGLTIGFLISIAVGLSNPAMSIDFTKFNEAAWIAPPKFYYPTLDWNAVSLIVPVVIVQVAENLGHVKAVGVIADAELMPYLGRAYLGDALATIVSGCFGGTALTTYAENIGVMAVTRVYSTIIFFIASLFAILLGFIPKFGALIGTIPKGIYGGLEIILFGLVASTGIRIWSQNKVDFGEPVNMLVGSVAIVLGAGMGSKTASFGPIQLDSLGLTTIICMIIHFLFRRVPELMGWKQVDEHLLEKDDLDKVEMGH